MPITFSYPGVYIEEIPFGARTIQGVGTSVAAFVGTAPGGRIDRAQRIVSFPEFVRHFGGIDGRSLLGYSVQHFFANGGHEAYVVRLAEEGLNPANARSVLSLLDRIDFDLLCVPGETNPAVVASLQKYCRDKRAFAIIDTIEKEPLATLQNGPDPALTGPDASNSALYFPWVKCFDPLQENVVRDFPPSGFVAGIYARTDRARGVWKAPAGSEAGLIGATGVTHSLTKGESEDLNSRGINSIRALPGYGTVAWGSRTLHGDDRLASEWKYVPVRRLALYIENSVFRGTRWAVFEPNDEPLWAQIRLNVGAFMHDLFRQGAFPGAVPRDAYFVKCGRDTTTQDDVDRGVVNIVVGFAPLRPAEFIVISIQQSAGRPVATTARHGVGTRRQDPYKNFKFRVKWEGRYVAGVSKVARLYRATGPVKHREGGDESSSSRSPGRTVYETVTLEHGVTHDSEFAKWASEVWNSELDSQGPPGDLRKDILIDVYDEAGRLALSCKVFHCWVSKFQGLPDLDANANAVVIQNLELEEEGWECECHATQPSGPTSTDTSG